MTQTILLGYYNHGDSLRIFNKYKPIIWPVLNLYLFLIISSLLAATSFSICLNKPIKQVNSIKTLKQQLHLWGTLGTFTSSKFSQKCLKKFSRLP